ncbi:MAG: hypothetical protein ACAI43_16235 [Phycisphaerae bacterium]|nr:hypothetical protein [Tepidisphaeraceae bacterium]
MITPCDVFLLARDAQLLKAHLTKRRQFLLGQPELRDAGARPKP